MKIAFREAEKAFEHEEVPIGAIVVKNGRVIRGWLGVGIQNLTPNLASTLKYGNTDGVLVNSVDNNTPAQNGGIKAGDIIFQFDGKLVSDSKFFQHLVAIASAWCIRWG